MAKFIAAAPIPRRDRRSDAHELALVSEPGLACLFTRLRLNIYRGLRRWQEINGEKSSQRALPFSLWVYKVD